MSLGTWNCVQGQGLDLATFKITQHIATSHKMFLFWEWLFAGYVTRLSTDDTNSTQCCIKSRFYQDTFIPDHWFKRHYHLTAIFLKQPWLLHWGVHANNFIVLAIKFPWTWRHVFVPEECLFIESITNLGSRLNYGQKLTFSVAKCYLRLS